MKSLKDYIVESEQWMESPTEGDSVGIELEDDTLLETYIMEVAEDGSLLLDSTDQIYSLLENWNLLSDDIDDDVVEDIDGDYNDRSTHGHRSTTEVEEQQADEAKYQGREVPLNKPMQGDVKKSKVYVRDPKTGNVKKVNFGDPNMKIKKSNPARRRSFRARHNCDNPGPKTKARYWSCRAW